MAEVTKLVYGALVAGDVDVSDKVSYTTRLPEYLEDSKERFQHEGVEVELDQDVIRLDVEIDRVKDEYSLNVKPNLAFMDVFNGEDCEEVNGLVILDLDKLSYNTGYLSEENEEKVRRAMQKIGIKKTLL